MAATNNISDNWYRKQVSLIPVLTSRGTVEIDNNLETVICCPTDRVTKVVALSLVIRFTATDIVSPISYWDAHVIESE